jgi:hypothetical protein
MINTGTRGAVRTASVRFLNVVSKREKALSSPEGGYDGLEDKVSGPLRFAAQTISTPGQSGVERHRRLE